MDIKHSENLLSESGGAVRFSGFSLARVPGSVLDLNGAGANRAASRGPNAGAPAMEYCYYAWLGWHRLTAGGKRV